MNPKLSADEIRQGLHQFCGTLEYHRTTVAGPVVSTDGVYWLCENAGAYWLMDVIASYQAELAKMSDADERKPEGIQFWKLEVTPATKTTGRSAVVTCVRDSGYEPAVKQAIEYTDFPLDEGVDIWVAPGGPRGMMVAMLKGEY